jgi:HSP20 family protein
MERYANEHSANLGDHSARAREPAGPQALGGTTSQGHELPNESSLFPLEMNFGVRISRADARHNPVRTRDIGQPTGETAMNNMVRQDPWSLMPRLQDEINRLFGDAQRNDSSSSATATWVPAVDIHEFTDRFELYVDVPGVDPNSVELTLDDGVLTLSGERVQKNSKANGEAQYRRTERSQGQFYRRFVLPDTVDSNNVKAAGKDGVLTVTIPKQAKAQPRRIQVVA